MLLDFRCVELNVPVGEDSVEHTDVKIQTELGVVPWKRQSESMHVTESAEKICLLIHLLYGRGVVIHLIDST